MTGWIVRAIDAGDACRNRLADVEMGRFVDIGATRAKVSQLWMLLVLSAVIAAGGGVVNNKVGPNAPARA